jgi:DNA-nicking Smr family endonuclease
MTRDQNEPPFDRPVELAIDGELDLHTFQPSELAPLLQDYIDACRAKGILSLRIIHGKGGGVLRERVHALLKKSPQVKGFRLAPPEAGGWGATLVELEAPRPFPDFSG